MNPTTYNRYVHELLRYVHGNGSNWLVLKSDADDVVTLDMKIADLDTVFTVKIVPEQNTRGVSVEVYVDAPDFGHPNMCCDRSLCLSRLSDSEDAEWTGSLVLLVWGVAQLLAQPNFSDPILNSYKRIHYADDYMKQFKNNNW